MIDDAPVQRVAPVRTRIVARDLSNVPAGEQAACVRARSEAIIRPPYALDCAPL